MWKAGKTQAFTSSLPHLQSSVMAWFRTHNSEQLVCVVCATSDLRARVQRLEAEQAALLARLEGDRQLRMLTAHIAAVAHVARAIGAAVERFAKAMRPPLPPAPRGRAGGLARAGTGWRYSDGTFMPDAERRAAIEEFELAEYERYAAGGRTRAASAVRDEGGKFISARERR